MLEKEIGKALLSASIRVYLRLKPSRLLFAKLSAAASRLLSKLLYIPLPILYYRSFIRQYYRFDHVNLEIGG